MMPTELTGGLADAGVPTSGAAWQMDFSRAD
jgi:hypothetical protein